MTKTLIQGIYGEINSPEDIRHINRRIRKEMYGVSEPEELTQLKKRSDHLCALTKAPSWRRKFSRKIGEILRVAKEENRKTAKEANQVAHLNRWTGNYDPWRG